MTNAWMVRAGKFGENEEWAFERGYVVAGWSEIGHELLDCTTKDQVGKIVSVAFQDSPKTIPSSTGQLWALKNRIKVGDLAVLPLKQTRELALGRVKSELRYLEKEDPSRRWVREVEWLNRVPRTAVKQDLLYTLGSSLTVFSPTRNQAVARLEALMETGTDPGIHQAPIQLPTQDPGLNSESEDLESDVDVEEVALDQISALIAQEFTGHALAHLVAEILNAEGFTTEEAPEGPDGGIDIIAGRGVLGLESPKILVQVKTPKVDRPVVQQLTGLVSSQEADYGLIVAWGGLTSAARHEVMARRFRIKVWDDQDVVTAVLRNYQQLPSAIKQSLPLKQIWVPSEMR